MFERFTDRARRVVVLAQEEARLLDHSYIGTEHLLLGLVREADGLAAHALHAHGIDLEEVQSEVVALVGRGTEPPGGNIPFTPEAKSALEASLVQALQLGHNYIGTEHLLLGVLAQEEGAARRVFDGLQVDTGALRQEVLDLLESSGAGRIEPDARRADAAQRRLVIQAMVADGVFARALQEHGVDPQAFLETLDRLIEDEAG